MSRTSADVVVVGAGPAGAALGLRLARVGCSVVLLEQSGYEQFRVGEALPPAAAVRLQRLGVWEPFLQTHPEPVHGVQSAWGTGELDSSSFFGHPLLNGWHLDRSRFDTMLTLAATGAGARVFRQTRARDVEFRDGEWSVNAGDLRIRAGFLVDATGRRAHLCQRLGIGRRQPDRLIGIAVRFAETHGGLPSQIESHPLGWWYSASLPNGGVIAIFFTDSDICAHNRLTHPVAWTRRLQESPHTSERIAGLTPNWPLRVFPAASHCLRRAAGDGWLAVGDAATGRDPLSSSGIDFALASAERASSALCALAAGRQESADEYDAEVQADFAAYLQDRRAYYAMERRWPESPFWQRRHFPLPAGSKPLAMEDLDSSLSGGTQMLPIGQAQ
jgi:flavin-dependent dehydrogenase